ncbi:response regulator, partial [Streptomyces sp. NPDC051815]|uniref:response regulator n=1 Tax=Streptomyces sp. NPDC051815 TaxID=3365674 RepID=UPI0037BA0081
TALAADKATTEHARSRQLVHEAEETERRLRARCDDAARQRLHEARQADALAWKGRAELQRAQKQAEQLRADVDREVQEVRERFDEEMTRLRGEAEAEAAQIRDTARENANSALFWSYMARFVSPVLPVVKDQSSPVEADSEQRISAGRGQESTSLAALMASLQARRQETGRQLAGWPGKQLAVRPVYAIEPAWTPAVPFPVQKTALDQAAAGGSAATGQLVTMKPPVMVAPTPPAQLPPATAAAMQAALEAEVRAARSRLEAERVDNPRRLLVWPTPDASTQQALSDRGYRLVTVHSREDVDAQTAAFPAALFVDPLTGPITRTALQVLRQAAVAAEIPLLVTAGLGHTTREAAYGGDPAVLLKALAPRDSDNHMPRVLLIEEHPEIALALTATMQRRGMHVTRAADEADAMTLAEQLRPNLVVMDLMLMPWQQVGILGWLRESGLLNQTPLVVYTAAVDQAALPQLASRESVLFLAERSTSPETQTRIVDALARISTR